MNQCQRIHLDEIEFDLPVSDNCLFVTLVELASWLVFPVVLIVALGFWLIAGRGRDRS